MNNWKDVTSYSQGDKTRVPRTFELRADYVRIVVTRMHGCGDSWFLRCHDLGIDSRELKSPDLSVCQGDAVAIIRARLKKALDALDAKGDV